MEEQPKYITYNKYTDELTAIPISDHEAYKYEKIPWEKRNRAYFITRGYAHPSFIRSSLKEIQNEIDLQYHLIDITSQITQLDESEALKNLIRHIRYVYTCFKYSDRVGLIENYIKEKFGIDVTS